MDILLFIIFGALVGWVASMVMGTSEGLIVDIVVGILGSMLGGWLMEFFNKGGVTGFNVYSFFVALLGAVVLLAILRALRN